MINEMKIRKIARIKKILLKGERQKRAIRRERNCRLKKGVAAIEEGGRGKAGRVKWVVEKGKYVWRL